MSSFSATNFFNRRFSSSRTLRRLASEVPNPLYLARQRYSVVSLMPYLRAVPAMLAVGNSDSAMIRMISSTVNRDCRMRSLLFGTSHYSSLIFGEHLKGALEGVIKYGPKAWPPAPLINKLRVCCH